MSEVILSCQNLTKIYGSRKVVDNVSFEIKKGSICGLVGKNGAGKTTLIRIFTGLVLADGGTFSVCPGMNRTSTTVAAIVERPSVYKDMTAMGNLTVQCKLLGIPVDNDYLTKTLALVGLDSALKTKAKDYSLGMQQRLAVAMTLVGRPELLILDEPTNGLDPQGIHDMRELFVKLNREFGTTILISSHILSELGKFATDYIFMNNGKVVKTVSADELSDFGEKRTRLVVSDTAKACEALKAFGNVVVTAENTVELSGETPSTQILLTLAQNGVECTSISTVGGDLEDYFISLVGGTQK